MQWQNQRIKTICQKHFIKVQKIKNIEKEIREKVEIKELKGKNKKLKNLLIKNW